MPRLRHIWNESPPVLRALGAQALTFLVLVALSRLFPALRSLPAWVWLLGQGGGAAALGAYWGLGLWWRGFQLFLPFALAWQAMHAVSPWFYPVALLLLLLIFGGGLLTRVPLYNSNRAAWEALLDLLPEGQSMKMVDLGAGLGGPLRFLAERRPGARFLGVEASPLVWFLAWLRTRAVAANCRMRLGSLWNEDLGTYDVVYAFLSPAPMPELGRKALAEMAPGTLLVSHTFPIPDLTPDQTIPLPGRPGACLLIYRVGGVCPTRGLPQPLP